MCGWLDNEELKYEFLNANKAMETMDMLTKRIKNQYNTDCATRSQLYNIKQKTNKLRKVYLKYGDCIENRGGFGFFE